MDKYRVLVTGALGMLGTELYQQLAQDKEEIHLLLLDTAPEAVFQARSRLIFGNLKSTVVYIQGDILSEETMRRLLSNVQTVYHVAGIVTYSKKQFKKMFQVNVEGTALVTRLAIELKVPKVIYASSISTVAACLGRDSNESDYSQESDLSISQYSISKIRAEQEFFANLPNNHTIRIAANIGVIIGKGPHLGRVIAAIKRYRIFPYLKTYNSYIDVIDVARGLIYLEKFGADNNRYILTSYNITNGEFTREVVRALGGGRILVTIPGLFLKFLYSIASIFNRFIASDAWKSITVNKSYSTDKIRTLGWMPSLSLAESVMRLLST